MDNNISPAEKKTAEKRGLFDSFEIKGLSAKSARAFSSGRAAAVVRYISRLLAFTPARAYGFSALSFGLLTLFLHLGEYYFMDDPVVAVSSLIIGAVFTLLSVPLLISDKPISIALQSVRIIDFIVFDFFSINRMQKGEGEQRLGYAAGIVCGFLLAILGFFLPTEYAALVIICSVFLAVSMVSPEFPYIFSLLSFPFLHLITHSEIILTVLIIVSVISFLRKMLVGKRVYALEVYDYILLFIILILLLTGVMLGGSASTKSALMIIVFILGYIPAASLAVNRRLCDCIAGAIVTSSIPISLYSVVGYIIGIATDKKAASSAFFSTPSVLCAYLSTAFIFAAFLSVHRSMKRKKRYYFVISVIDALAIITTEYFAIPIALILTLAALSVIRSRRIPKLSVLVIFALPLLLLLLPESAALWLSERLTAEPRVSDFLSAFPIALDRLFDNFFFGIGANGFGAGEPYSYSTSVAFTARFGIFAFVAALVLIVIRLLHFGIYKKYYSDSTVAFYADASMLATVCMLILGSYADIFDDFGMVYFFVAVFALGSSALRISKKERLERISYYTDAGSSDFAGIDITVK